MENGESIALETVREYIEDKTEVVIKHFPMGKKDKEIKPFQPKTAKQV